MCVGTLETQQYNKRKRRFVKSCWNCNENISDPDGELDGRYCLMDGSNVNPSMICDDWELEQ